VLIIEGLGFRGGRSRRRLDALRPNQGRPWTLNPLSCTLPYLTLFILHPPLPDPIYPAPSPTLPYLSCTLPYLTLPYPTVRLLDLKALEASLPIPPPRAGSPPVCVMGGGADYVVDTAGLEETAAWAAAGAAGAAAGAGAGAGDTIVLDGAAHDLMLDTRWEEAATALEGWMRDQGV